MFTLDEKNEHKWKREPQQQRREQKHSEVYDELRLPREHTREEYKRAVRHPISSGVSLNSEVTNLLHGKGSVQQVLSKVPLGTRQEPGQLAWILDRIRAGNNNELNGERQSAKPVIQHLLARFVRCRTGVAPEHVAEALRCARFFNIWDENIVVPLATKFDQLARLATENQILTAIPVLAKLARHRGLMLKELGNLSNVLEQKISRGPFSSDFRPTKILHVLASESLIHPPIQNAIHALLFDGGRAFQTLELKEQVATMRSYGILGMQFPKNEFDAVSHALRKQAIYNSTALSALDIAAYVSAAALLDIGKSQLLPVLEKLFHEKLRAFVPGLARSRLIYDAIPAFALLLNEPMRETSKIFTRPLQSYNGVQTSSNFETRIGKILQDDLKAPFKHSVSGGMFALDFVITQRSGRLVNLEVDGVNYHLLYDISQQTLTTRYRGLDHLRDRAVRKLGYLVARVHSQDGKSTADFRDVVRARIRDAS
jgi:hypothetical protein